MEEIISVSSAKTFRGTIILFLTFVVPALIIWGERGWRFGRIASDKPFPWGSLLRIIVICGAIAGFIGWHSNPLYTIALGPNEITLTYHRGAPLTVDRSNLKALTERRTPSGRRRGLRIETGDGTVHETPPLSASTRERVANWAGLPLVSGNLDDRRLERPGAGP